MKDQQKFCAEESKTLFELTEEDVLLKYVFNFVIPNAIKYSNSIDVVLDRVALVYKVSKKTYMTEFLNHPEWPTPGSIIKKYNELSEIG